MRRFFSGNTIDQAVLLAAREHQMDPDDIAYEVVEKKHGFLRIRRRVVIEVDPESPRRASKREDERQLAQSPPPPSVESAAREDSGGKELLEEAPRQPDQAERAKARYEPELVDLPAEPTTAGERFPRASGAMALTAEKGLGLMLDFADLDLGVEVLQGNDRLEIELSGPDSRRVVDDHGKVLLAVQHLLPRIIRGFIGESIACRVDCDNFHLIREERLRDMAQRAADEVRRRGRPWTLSAMPPDERRIVHLTLSDDPAVETESVGSGFFKKIRVLPS